MERRGGKAFQLVVAKFKAGVLAGDKQPRLFAAGGERMGNRA
jgi:hypothetical protein